LDTLERLLAANGQRLLAVPIPSFEQRQDRRGKPFFVPHQLPQLPPTAAMAQVHLPMHVNWSNPEQIWDLSNRSQRLLAYQMLIAEGGHFLQEWGEPIARAALTSFGLGSQTHPRGPDHS
jgi:hypothetical protein